MTTPLPVLPQIIVEAGFISDKPVQGGTSLILGDAVNGKLGTGTLGTSINWTSVSPWVRSFTITRPSTRLQGPLWNFQAATASILLDNSDGRFDPDNLAGPYVTGAPSGMTVTATQSGAGSANGMALTVRVVTGALPAASQNGTVVSNNSSLTTCQAAITPAATGSWVYGALTNGSNTTALTANGSTTLSANIQDLTNAIVYGTCRSTGTTTASTPVTVGASAPSGSTGAMVVSLAEIKAASALAEDASSPPTVSITSAKTVTTASFIPPGSSLLVAMVSNEYSGSGTNTVTVSDSSGLTWHPLTQDSYTVAGVWVADVPASAAVTQLTPMVPVRVRANFGSLAYSLFSGFADGWLPAQVTYEGGYAELTLPATDAFKVLAGITLPPVLIEGAGADTGARIRDILTRAGWYTSAERNVISTGNSTLQGTTLGSDALSLMQVAADSEIGQLYVNGAGAVTFRARRDLLTDARSNSVQAVFGDLPGTVQAAGTELAYAAISRASDDTTLVNDIQATRAGGTLQEAQDAASIAKYLFPRTYARTDLILQNDADALNWANWVLYIGKGGEDRIDSLQVDPQADTANLWPQVLGREIGDRIQVWQRPAGLGAPVSKDCFIAGITHAWDSVASTWLTTWTLQDASKYGSFLTLDNPTLGQLGSNALAF